MKKSTRIFCIVILAVVVLTVAAVSMNAAIDGNDADAEAIQNAVKEAELLHIGSDKILDETGTLDVNCLENYRTQLVHTFTPESGEIEQLYDLMQMICEIFDETTDTTLENAIIDFNTRSLKVDGNTATIVCDMTTLQKYIPYIEEEQGGSFRTFFAVGTATETCELIKGGDGVWRVASMEESNYQFGSAVDMKLADTLLERSFATREEAYAYANSLSVEDICPLLK